LVIMQESVAEVTSAGVFPMGASAEPVFVLCAARSGSTLLRFLLDAHPDLACPPETNVPTLCGQLATVWSLIEGAPLSQNRGDEPPEIPDAAIAGVRETMDRMVGSYLARRGKKRYCDKSLGTAQFAYLMSRVWPESKFLCLFRHPMDVIASGIEACPWGLQGYGFDRYGAESPGNSVFALARFWVDNAATILAARDRYPDRCHTVRYEDLVADPESVAQGIFDFLGVPRVPGISEYCFSPERERFGPADYKIWHTSKITSDSVGRGWSIPAGLIPAQVRATMNELAGKLGYVPVDEGWGTADAPADLRADIGDPQAVKAPADAGGAPAAISVPGLVERLNAALSRIDDRFIRDWDPYSKDSFTVVITPSSEAAPGGGSGWLVDLEARTVTPLQGTGVEGDAEDEDDDSDWDIIGSAETWESVIDGTLNLSVALRRYQLRYTAEGGADGVATVARVGMLSELLGLTSWGRPMQTERDQGAAPDASLVGERP